MEKQLPGSLVSHIAIALITGAFASVLTLAASNRLNVVELAQQTATPASNDLDTGSIGTLEQIPSATDDGPLPDQTSGAGVAASIEIAALRQALDEASAERRQLSTSLVTLTRQMDDIEAELVNLNARASLGLGQSSDPDGTSSGTDSVPEFNIGEDFAGPGEQGRGGQARFESLLAAGLDEQSARDLQARGDQYQLARLELFDQAAREGWADSEELTSRLDELNSGRVDLREELGDTAYDRYLYASGSPNRVTIASIISGSAADLAGLRAGDVIDSYANERIFRAQELQQATRSGSRGAFVQLLFERDGQSMSADVPRGPLGVTLGSARIQP